MRNKLFFFFILILSSCAIQVPPGGGDKDVAPPELTGSEPELFATGYSGNTVKLDFNEFVQMRDAATQLIISPPLKQQPVVKVRNKSVFISFEEDTLLPNTTYTMNFGSALVDVNEGNVKQDFQFVFSTGDHIDSLAVSGSVLNSYDLKSDAGYTVMLYKGNDDSLPLNSRPDYFSRTAKDGSFRIRNIAQGDYKIIALKDADGDYKYAPSVESIAWTKDRVSSGEEGVKLLMFTEQPKLAISKILSDYPGKARVILNRPVENKGFQWLMDTTATLIYRKVWSKESDTLSLYYENVNYDSLKFRLEQFPKDTVIIRLLRLQGRQGGRGEKFTLAADRTGELPYFRPLYLHANRVVKSLDVTKFIVREDSLPVQAAITIEDSLNGKIRVDFNWKQKRNYHLQLLPEAVQSLFYDKSDSLQFSFVTSSETDYGALTVHATFPEKGNYIIQLVDNDDRVYYEQNFSGVDGHLSFTKLDPRQYRLKAIVDTNGNKKWDTGDYLRHVQPETVLHYPEQVTVRANWDVEVDWKKK